MKAQRRLMATAICMIVILAVGAVASAQNEQREKQSHPRHDVIIQHGEIVMAGEPHAEHMALALEPGQHHEGDTFVFVSSEMSIDSKMVKGAPYSAQAVTESIQTLGDGNRIVRRSTALIYRDGEGRTRREQTLAAVGPWATGGNPPQRIFINDPVGGVNYILDANSKTARKLTVHHGQGDTGATAAGTPPAPRAGVRRPRAEVFAAPAPPPLMGERATFQYRRAGGDAKKESLGKQVIEGVEAEGTRSTITIPAGEIGNEQPILIVSERWYSPELQTVVLTKHSDPRFGETTYRLTNINRSEPARSLFEVPADYSVKEENSLPRRVRVNKLNEN